MLQFIEWKNYLILLIEFQFKKISLEILFPLSREIENEKLRKLKFS